MYKRSRPVGPSRSDSSTPALRCSFRSSDESPRLVGRQRLVVPRSRVRASLTRQTHESRSRSDKVRLIRPRRPVRLRDGPRRGAAGGKQEPRAQARARAPQKSNAAQTNESLAIQHRSTFREYISCVRGGGATAYTVLALAYNHISYDTFNHFIHALLLYGHPGVLATKVGYFGAPLLPLIWDQKCNLLNVIRA